MSTLKKKFKQYHKENPQVFRTLVKFSKQVKRAGYKKYSINGIFERVRWHYNIEQNDASFKLNNNWRSVDGRRVMRKIPEVKGLFEIRRQPSKDEK